MNQHELFVIGRCLIAAMFFVSAFGKAMNWKKTVSLMQLHNLPFPGAALIAAITVEFTGAICLIIDRFSFLAMTALFGFVVFATVTIPLQDVVRGKNRDSALQIIGSNLAILGALLLVLGLRNM